MASLIGSGGGIADFFPKKCPFEKPPIGYVACNGDKIDPVTQPVLFSIYGISLPDMRGLVVRGLDDGKGHDKDRKILSFQLGSVESHGHEISSFNYGVKQVDKFNHGRKWTNSGGNHRHPIHKHSRDDAGNNNPEAGGRDLHRSGWTDFAGVHNHYLDIGEHGHSINIGNHGHTAKNYGENETRMMNIAMLFIVKNG